MERSFFPQTLGQGVWFQDDSSTLHLLCTLFLLLLDQFHFRSSGIRSQRLGTPDLESSTDTRICLCVFNVFHAFSFICYDNSIKQAPVSDPWFKRAAEGQRNEIACLRLHKWYSIALVFLSVIVTCYVKQGLFQTQNITSKIQDGKDKNVVLKMLILETFIKSRGIRAWCWR